MIVEAENKTLRMGILSEGGAACSRCLDLDCLERRSGFVPSNGNVVIRHLVMTMLCVQLIDQLEFV